VTDGPEERALDGAVAGLVAGLVSGVPSTAMALVRRENPLAATLAAGSLVLPRERRDRRLIAAAVPTHLAISLGWGIVLGRVLPRRNAVSLGALAGLAIAALDLGVIGRGHPSVRRLRTLPQVADHVTFGAVAGWWLGRC
jgi:hypothetical protein